MKFQLKKHDWIKISVSAFSFLGICVLIWWNTSRTETPEKHPPAVGREKLADVQNLEREFDLLLARADVTQNEIISLFSRIDSVCQKRRAYGELARISRKAADSKKLSGDFLIIVRFAHYSAMFFDNKPKEALQELYRILGLNMSDDARGAMFGEVARCKARLEGLPSALAYLGKIMENPKTAPAMTPYLYNMYAALLCQNGRRAEAAKKLLEGANHPGLDASRKRIFLQSVGALLSRSKTPAEDLLKLAPAMDAGTRFQVLNAAAEILLRERNFAGAEKIYRNFASDVRLDANLRKISELKLEICREGMKK